MKNNRVFVKESIIPATMSVVLDFHRSADAFRHLTMPPVFVQILEDSRTSLTEGVLIFNLWIGPFPVRWVARHESGDTPTSFVDRMIEGPMETWIHQHIFEPVPGGVRVIDKISFAHKPGLRGYLTQLFFDGLPLRILFIYRHWITKKKTVWNSEKNIN